MAETAASNCRHLTRRWAETHRHALGVPVDQQAMRWRRAPGVQLEEVAFHGVGGEPLDQPADRR